MIDMTVDVGTVLAPWQVVSCVYECVLLVIGLLLCASIPYLKPLPTCVLRMREQALKALETCLVSHTP